ncbi:hypothetical protein GOZ78_00145 [Agrobacterium vitis]|uniref:Uncharacterized protein n=1 Tax=Agrobacterium vitis TaxID=373 RepID=A0ABD6G8Q2_AGRVI|nr:hypothetical protein [Agrobacterium vitis]MUO82166.1 hypothetical protein [Agrobacterium vitis]MUO97490.1 hypothetical protein [Agrobacterium vitis]MUP05650.1 hypothetical protein [Agrobacterium vitis]MUZ85323.1 hypothetical protein [Agrobacterium vitis]MVA08429.1 hypothetical protein [Agrobacterium vitis]
MASKSIIGSIAAGLIAWTVPATTAPVPDAVPMSQMVSGTSGSSSPVIVQAQNQNQNSDNSDGNDSKSNGRVDCRSAALRAVEQAGGQLLSVRLSGGQCVITILVPGTGDNARPRKMTVQVSR